MEYKASFSGDVVGAVYEGGAYRQGAFGMTLAINASSLYGQPIHRRGAILLALRLVSKPNPLGPRVDTSIRAGTGRLSRIGRLAARGNENQLVFVRLRHSLHGRRLFQPAAGRFRSIVFEAAASAYIPGPGRMGSKHLGPPPQNPD